MKITKINRMHVAIKDKSETGVILYESPSENEISVNENIKAYVKNAVEEVNKKKRYLVFCSANDTSILEEHFMAIVRIAREAKDLCDFKREFKEYMGCKVIEEPRGKKKKKKKKIKTKTYSLNKFFYEEPMLPLEYLVRAHIKERMISVAWLEVKYRAVIEKILYYLCDKNRNSEFIDTLTEEEFFVLKEFVKNERCYVERTNRVEGQCTRLLKIIARSDIDIHADNFKQRITWCVERYKFEGRQYCVYRDYTDELNEERLNMILKRLDRTLAKTVEHRECIKKIFIELAKGYKQLEINTLVDIITPDFVDAVNQSYYRGTIIKSIENHKMKVEPVEGELELSNIANKKGLEETLKEYAISRERGEQVLKKIKKILFSYFLDEKTRNDINVEKRSLWKIPYKMEALFDEGFICDEVTAINNPHIYVNLILEECLLRKDEELIRARINFVNYEKYKKLNALSIEENNDFQKYWIAYIHKFVKKNYVDKKSIEFHKENLQVSRMMLDCWKDILRFICGKYIDLGKAVYHFVMPKTLGEDRTVNYLTICNGYENGIPSFEYELLQATNNLQRSVSTSFGGALNAFTASIIDQEKVSTKSNEVQEQLGDILHVNDKTLRSSVLRDENKLLRLLLRFYGGESSINEPFRTKIGDNVMEFTDEVESHLKLIRNRNYHFTDYEKKQVSNDDVKYTRYLLENEKLEYKKALAERYIYNNVTLFYSDEIIAKWIGQIYTREGVTDAQIPALNTILPRKELWTHISERSDINLRGKHYQSVQIPFIKAYGFLLQEIYYHDFVKVVDKRKLYEKVNEELEKLAKEMESVEAKRAQLWQRIREARENNQLADELGQEFEDIKEQIRQCSERCGELKGEMSPYQKFQRFILLFQDNDKISFGSLCQKINMESYRRSACSRAKKRKYKTFEIVLCYFLKEIFWDYVMEHYPEINSPDFHGGRPYKWVELKMKREILAEKFSDIGEITTNDCLCWYTFAHFIHPKQLKQLIVDYRNFIQYLQDIQDRAQIAGCVLQTHVKIEEEIAYAQKVLAIFEFVRVLAGRISRNNSDYYETSEEQIELYESYFEKVDGSIEWIKEYGLYAKKDNLKLIRQIENARMYYGDKLPVQNYKKIQLEEVQFHYDMGKKVSKILVKSNPTEQEHKLAVLYQQNKNRITLYDINELSQMVNDLLGSLVSMAYLRERDQMYLLLGFYYLICKNNPSEANWDGEIKNTYKFAKGNEEILYESGFELEQIVSIFQFGKRMPYINAEGKSEYMGGSIGSKTNKFREYHTTSFDWIMALFEYDKERENATYVLRNYIDHGKYYVNYDRSIVDLYSVFYTNFFSYSTKLRKNVMETFRNVLKKYFIDIEGKILLETIDGKTQIKLPEVLETEDVTYVSKEGWKQISTRSKEFLVSAKNALEYSSELEKDLLREEDK